MLPEAPPRFILFSREGCALCEEMLDSLRALPEMADRLIEVRDVDADAESQRRFGHKVPVLLLNGEVVCHGSLDREELHKTLALYR